MPLGILLPRMQTRKPLLIGAFALILIGAGLWFTGVFSFNSEPGVPSLERPLTFPENFPAEARTAIETNTARLKSDLEADPGNISAWLDLAIQYKAVNDFDGAVEIWKYLAEAKDNSIAYYNLGNIYHLYLKDFPTSERYYHKAIEMTPSMPLNYVGLHELYRYSYKQDSNLAIETLNEGMENTDERGRVDLYIALAAYHLEKGETSRALLAYTEARALAVELGNTALVNSLDSQIRSIE